MQALGQLRATYEEVAVALDCGVTTVRDRMAKDEEFSAAYHRGEETRKTSLRRMLWDRARTSDKVLLHLAQCELGMVPIRKVEDVTPRRPLRDPMDQEAVEEFLQSHLGTTLEEFRRQPTLN